MNQYSKEFYIAISNLFYAVSMIDKNMSIDEKKEIIWAVKEEWATNEYGFNSEELIYETLRAIIKEKLPAEQAFHNFKNFYNTNHLIFTTELQNSLLETCLKISNAYRGKNKSELILLAQLQMLFKGSST